ncbi:MAG: hypothetical protein HRT89_23845 [Lentisphaeria bacterium]|nr:hypothetical protein [Lentisphaeria bacterium]
MATDNTSHYPVWNLIQSPSDSSVWNMAIDQYLLDTIELPVIRFYQWNHQCKSIGYFQSHALVDSADFIRRPSGGGIVQHGKDLTISFIFPASHPLFQLDRFDSYKEINQELASAMSKFYQLETTLYEHTIDESIDRRTMVCFEAPSKYDGICNGEKVFGGAQKRTRSGMLHQASIQIDKFETKDTGHFISQIIDQLKTSWSIEFKQMTIDKNVCIEHKNKFASKEWNYKK